MQQLDCGDCRGRPDRGPELLGEGASEDEVVGRLKRSRADGAASPGNLNNVLTQKHISRVYLSLDQELGEEADPVGGVARPDEVGEGRSHSTKVA